MTQQCRAFVPIKFRSLATEQEFRRICHTHGISFDYIAKCLNEDYIIIEPGSVDLERIDIGRDRFLENPSRSLEMMFHACISGMSYARGKPLKGDDRPILEGIVIN